MGWTLPLDKTLRVIHLGDISELGSIVAGAFAHPDEAGNGEYLPLVGDFMSFNEIVETLNRQGHNFHTHMSGAGRGLFLQTELQGRVFCKERAAIVRNRSEIFSSRA